jgi:hypothetical protein
MDTGDCVREDWGRESSGYGDPGTTEERHRVEEAIRGEEGQWCEVRSGLRVKWKETEEPMFEVW